MKKKIVLLLLTSTAILAVDPPKKPYRTAAECNAGYPGAEKKGERDACNHCIERPQKHQYDPAQKPGKRCTPAK